jgi:hypothetical protein
MLRQYPDEDAIPRQFCFKMVQVRNGMDELVGIQRNGLIHKVRLAPSFDSPSELTQRSRLRSKLALKVDTELLVLIGQTINETVSLCLGRVTPCHQLAALTCHPIADRLGRVKCAEPCLLQGWRRRSAGRDEADLRRPRLAARACHRLLSKGAGLADSSHRRRTDGCRRPARALAPSRHRQRAQRHLLPSGFLLAVELVRPRDEYDENVLEGCDFQVSSPR